MHVATRLREERARLGFGQAEFAAALGVSLKSQSNYETGKRCPDTDYLIAAAKLGVDVLLVVTGSPSMIASQEEADLLRRYRSAHPAVRVAVSAALGAIEAPAVEYHESQRARGEGRTPRVHENHGQYIEGDQHIAGSVTINTGGSKKGSRK